ncbi:MAG: hypothetical protein ACI9E5_001112 [Candidatus Omnitrophota bacterium]|jgi:hypothetical protein
MPSNDSERRNLSRAKRVMSIKYRTINGPTKSPWLLSTTDDMSANSVSFLSEVELRIGDTVEVEVRMSGLVDVFSGISTVQRSENKTDGGSCFIAVKLLEGNPKKKRSAKSYNK